MTERRRGRPPVGPRIHVNLPAADIAWLDDIVKERAEEGVTTTRAAVVREIIGEVRRADDPGVPQALRPHRTQDNRGEQVMTETAIRGYDVFCYENGEPVDYVVNPLGNKQPLPKTITAARALTEDVVAGADGEMEWTSETRGLATYHTDGEVTSVDEIRIEPIGYDDDTYADLPDPARHAYRHRGDPHLSRA